MRYTADEVIKFWNPNWWCGLIGDSFILWLFKSNIAPHIGQISLEKCRQRNADIFLIWLMTIFWTPSRLHCPMPVRFLFYYGSGIDCWSYNGPVEASLEPKKRPESSNIISTDQHKSSLRLENNLTTPNHLFSLIFFSFRTEFRFPDPSVLISKLILFFISLFPMKITHPFMDIGLSTFFCFLQSSKFSADLYMLIFPSALMTSSTHLVGDVPPLVFRVPVLIGNSNKTMPYTARIITRNQSAHTSFIFACWNIVTRSQLFLLHLFPSLPSTLSASQLATALQIDHSRNTSALAFAKPFRPIHIFITKSPLRIIYSNQPSYTV